MKQVTTGVGDLDVCFLGCLHNCSSYCLKVIIKHVYKEIRNMINGLNVSVGKKFLLVKCHCWSESLCFLVSMIRVVIFID